MPPEVLNCLFLWYNIFMKQEHSKRSPESELLARAWQAVVDQGAKLRALLPLEKQSAFEALWGEMDALHAALVHHQASSEKGAQQRLKKIFLAHEQFLVPPQDEPDHAVIVTAYDDMFEEAKQAVEMFFYHERAAREIAEIRDVLPRDRDAANARIRAIISQNAHLRNAALRPPKS